jgi:hypothetical protein
VCDFTTGKLAIHANLMHPWLRWFLLLFLGSPKEYRIPPGGSVLVIEITKHYVRYFKLKKPLPAPQPTGKSITVRSITNK